MSIMVNLNHGNRWLLTSSSEEFLAFSVRDWISCANKAIASKGRFLVALSGGSTPLLLFSKLVENKAMITDPSRIFFFWGDERCVPPDSPESNYGNAMAILKNLGTPLTNFFRMEVENPKGDIEYEGRILEYTPQGSFDFIMLGIGEDGHTASLFPNTSALKARDALVTFNDVPQLQSRRMTLTLPCLQRGKHVVFYVKGSGKKGVIKKILESCFVKEDNHNPRTPFPAEQVGTEENPAFWFLSPETYDLFDYDKIPSDRKLILP